MSVNALEQMGISASRAVKLFTIVVVLNRIGKCWRFFTVAAKIGKAHFLWAAREEEA